MATSFDHAATLYPAAPFKAAPAATASDNLSFAPSGQFGQTAETKPADSAEGEGVANFATPPDQAATLYPDDPFAPYRQLGDTRCRPLGLTRQPSARTASAARRRV